MKRAVKNMIVTGTVIACLGTSTWGADAAAGKAVYDKKCKTCHGPAGEGNPGMAKVLGTTITPLGSDEVQKMPDADLKKVVMQGKGKMKPITGLTDADVDNVVAHVRTLKK